MPAAGVRDMGARWQFARGPEAMCMLACELCGFEANTWQELLEHLKADHLGSDTDGPRASWWTSERMVEEYRKRLVFYEQVSGGGRCEQGCVSASQLKFLSDGMPVNEARSPCRTFSCSRRAAAEGRGEARLSSNTQSSGESSRASLLLFLLYLRTWPLEGRSAAFEALLCSITGSAHGGGCGGGNGRSGDGRASGRKRS